MSTSRYPWASDTTPNIADQDDPRYETPGGAQERINTSLEGFEAKTYNIKDLSVTKPKIAYGSVGGDQLDPALLQNYGDIAVQGKFQQVDAAVSSISNWNYDLIAALAASDYVYIPKDTTVVLSRTLVKADLDGKKIRGENGTSIIRVFGNMSAFDFTGCNNPETSIANFTIVVDTTNTSIIVNIGNDGATSTTTYVNVNRIIVRCPFNAQGNYMGMRVYSDGQGVYLNEINDFRVISPNNGFLAHAEAKPGVTLAWITLNRFHGIFVQSMRHTGIESRQTEINDAHTQLSQNSYIDPRVQDLINATGDRFGIVVGGSADTYLSPRVFSDAPSGRLYALQFNAQSANLWVGKYNYIIGGCFEGLVGNPEYLDFNSVDSLTINQPNFSTPADINGFVKLENRLTNVLRNANFSEDKLYWKHVGADTFEVQPDTTAEFGRSLKATKTTSTGLAVYQPVQDRALYAGRKCSFIARVKVTGVTDPSTQFLKITIDEGGAGSNQRLVPVSGDWQTIYVDRNIAGTGEALNCQIDLTAGIANPVIQIAWAIMTSNGYARTSKFIPANTSYLGPLSHTGTAVIQSGTTSVVVNHGLGDPPPTYKIKVTPTNSMGSALKWWLTQDNATSFTIHVDIDPGVTEAFFTWSIDL